MMLTARCDRATPAQREQTLELLFETFEVSKRWRGLAAFAR